MKPASIISLVIAVILIIVGLVTCFIAQNTAQANGEHLFAEVRNDNLVHTIDLSNSEISKIELIADNTEINIIGQAENSYIEFVNFRDNRYSLSATNRVLSFDEIPDVLSMLKFWENGFSFKGMRYILNFNDQPSESMPKVINVYLTSERLIKIFEIHGDELTINIENMTSASDYNIASDSAVITVNSLRTGSSFNVHGDDEKDPADSVTLTVKTALINNLSILSKVLQMDADYFHCSGNGFIGCDSGLVDIATVRQIAELNLHLTSQSGPIYVDGLSVESPYNKVAGEDNVNVFTVEAKSAEIRVSPAASPITNNSSADAE